jgi:hypothetical protein
VPGLGRQNRKQGLGEYAVERGVVVEFAASPAASGTVGGAGRSMHTELVSAAWVGLTQTTQTRTGWRRRVR